MCLMSEWNRPALHVVKGFSFPPCFCLSDSLKYFTARTRPHAGIYNGLDWKTTSKSKKERKKRERERETTSSPLARLTSHEDSPAVVRVSGAASVLPAVVHNPRGGKGVALLLEEAFGQTAERVLVLFPPPKVVLQRDALGLRAVPDLHAHFGVCTPASTLLLRAPLLACK